VGDLNVPTHDRLIASLATILGLVVAVPPAVPQTAYAAVPETSSSAGMYWCITDTTLCKTAFTTIPGGTDLDMICWRDGRTANSTNRWFYVKTAGGKVGFVIANKVINQTVEPACSTKEYIVATLWATAKNGQTAYENLCLTFVKDAYASVGVSIGSYGTPHKMWTSYPTYDSSGTKVKFATTSTNVPRGALVVWGGSSSHPEGHVAISLGNGYAMSTYERNIEPIHLMSIAERNQTHGATYRGYIKPIGAY
jgi:NlpC/P60 family